MLPMLYTGWNKPENRQRLNMNEPKIKVWSENGKVTVTIESGTSLNDLLVASLELYRKALRMQDDANPI
jgi:hypothetical protein